jgi:hypothetical protein
MTQPSRRLRHREAPECRFLCFEPDGGWTLRALFAVVDAEGRTFQAIARVFSTGALADLQASDTDLAGTTGRPAVDELIGARVEEELARARAVPVVAEFDRSRAG